MRGCALRIFIAGLRRECPEAHGRELGSEAKLFVAVPVFTPGQASVEGDLELVQRPHHQCSTSVQWSWLLQTLE